MPWGHQLPAIDYFILIKPLFMGSPLGHPEIQHGKPGKSAIKKPKKFFPRKSSNNQRFSSTPCLMTGGSHTFALKIRWSCRILLGPHGIHGFLPPTFVCRFVFTHLKIIISKPTRISRTSFIKQPVIQPVIFNITDTTRTLIGR